MNQKRYWLRGGLIFIAIYFVFAGWVLSLPPGGHPSPITLLAIPGMFFFRLENQFIYALIFSSIFTILFSFLTGSAVGILYGFLKSRNLVSTYSVLALLFFLTGIYIVIEWDNLGKIYGILALLASFYLGHKFYQKRKKFSQY